MPRDYADKLADALGAGFNSGTARAYAGGAFALRRRHRARRFALLLLRGSPRSVEPDEEEEAEEDDDAEPDFNPDADYEE